jgi:hypothetical protein
MFDDWGKIIEEVKKLSDAERGPYTTWLVVTGIRDLAYYAICGLVAWALGRRLIQGILSAIREASRERA